MQNIDYDYLEIETYNKNQSNPDNMPIDMLKQILEQKPKLYGYINRGLQEQSQKVFGDNQDQNQEAIELEMDKEEELSEIADLKCPITQCVMENPVTSKCGHTYDYDSIKDWINTNRHDCPNCKKNITLNEMKPNFYIRSLIKKLAEINNQQIINKRLQILFTKNFIQNVIFKKELKILFCKQI